jgi:CubicO group peptidase (beta-lactamase class C family)
LVAQGEEPLVLMVGGLANRDFGIANTVDTRFDTASVTKLFTAAAILQLIGQGKLAFDSRVYDLIDLGGTMIPEDVQIEHLLTHTSGIADDADEEAGEDYAALFVDKPNYAIRSCADFLPNFAYKAPMFQAGTNVRYNNCAFVLLGLVIEKITGTGYRDYVTERIFKAAGMERTYFGAMDEVRPNTAEGYFAVEHSDGSVTWKKSIYSYPPIGTADGGALTTVTDLHRFIRAIKGGVLLSPEYSALMLAPHCAFTRQHRHGNWRTGYAFEFIESGDETFCLYKEGLNAGVDAICAYFPAQDIGVYLLANAQGTLWRMYREIQAAVADISV